MPVRPPTTPIVAIALALSVLCAGCDEAIVAPAVPTTCSQIGSQCQLPAGPLGVCEQIACAPGAEAPCFKCVSQH